MEIVFFQKNNYIFILLNKTNLILQRNFIKLFYKYLVYRNTLYWDATFKFKNLGICACTRFLTILDYGFNAASKTGI